MADPVNKGQNNEGIQVEITTGSATQNLEALNQVLSKMGGLLNTNLTKLDDTQKKLLTVSKNAKRLSDTVGQQFRIQDKVNAGRRTESMGDAGVSINSTLAEAAQIAKNARALKQERLTNINEQLSSLKSKRQMDRYIQKLIKGGQEKELRTVIDSQRAFAKHHGDMNLASGADRAMEVLNSSRIKLMGKAREANEVLKAQVEEATRKAKKEAERVKRNAEREEANRIKQEARQAAYNNTPRGRINAINDRVIGGVLDTPTGSMLYTSAAIRKQIAIQSSGLRQQEINRMRALGEDQLFGPNRISRFNPNSDYTKNRGRLSADIGAAKTHIEALEQMKVGRSREKNQDIDRAIQAVRVELSQLSALASKLNGVSVAASKTAQELLKSTAAGKLSRVDLTGANNLNTNKPNLNSLTNDQLGQRRLDLRAGIAKANSAVNLASTAGDKAAEGSARKLLSTLTAQREELNSIVRVRENNIRAIQREAEELSNLKKKDLRSTSINQDIAKAKTLADLDKLRRDHLNEQLKASTRMSLLAGRTGDNAAKTKADSLIAQYQAEKRAIQERESAIKEQGSVTRRFQRMTSSEGQGGLFATRALFMKDMLLMNGLFQTVTGGFAFLRDFEAALKQTQAIAQGTETQMEGLRQSILKVSDTSRFSAIELTEATTTLAQAGFSISDIQKTLGSVTQLATATGTTLADSVELATSTLGAFKLSADSMPEVVNQITQAMNLSKLDVPKFMLATQYAGNAASDLGVSFREMLSATAAVANAGIRSGSTMGTGLRQLLADLTSPSEVLKKKLLDLGLTLADIDVRVNGLTGVMKNLKEAGFTTADAFGSFDLRATAYYVALNSNLAQYDLMYAAMDNTTAAIRAQEIQMNSLAAQTDRMTNQFRIAADVLGGDLRKSLTATAKGIADVTQGFNEMADHSVAGAILQWVALTAVLGSGILVIRNMGVMAAGLIGILTQLRVGMAATAATGTLMSGLLGAPLLAVFAAAGAAALAYSIASRAMKTEQEKLNEEYDIAATNLKVVEERVSAYESAIRETSEKINSLSARSDSLKDNQSELAVEFDVVRKKAIELGIDLTTKVESSVTSLRESWSELRKELNQRIVLDLEVKRGALQLEQASARALYNAKRDGGFFSGDLASDKSIFKNIDAKGNVSDISPRVEINGLSDAGMAAAISRKKERAKLGSKALAYNELPKVLETLSGDPAAAANLTALLGKLGQEASSDPEKLKQESRATLFLLNKVVMYVAKAISNEQSKQSTFRASGNKDAADAAQQNITLLQEAFNNPNSGIMGWTYALKDLANQSNVGKLNEYNLNVAKARTQNLSLGNGTQEFFNRGNINKVSPKALNGLNAFKEKYGDLFAEAAIKYGISPDILMAMGYRESGGNPRAVSSAGAKGIMQLMPKTGAEMGLKPEDFFDAAKSIDAGAKYMSILLKKFDMSNAVMHYNAGPATKDKKGNPRKYRQESLDYVGLVANNAVALGSKQTGSKTSEILRNTDENPQVVQLAKEEASLSSTLSIYTAKYKALDKDTSEALKVSAEIAVLQERLNEVSTQRSNLLNSARQQTKDDAAREILDKEYELSIATGELNQAKTELSKFNPKSGSLDEYTKLADSVRAKAEAVANAEYQKQLLSDGETNTTSSDLTIDPKKKRIAEAKLAEELKSIKVAYEEELAATKIKIYEAEKKRQEDLFALTVRNFNKQFAVMEKRIKDEEQLNTAIKDRMILESEAIRKGLEADKARMDLESNRGKYTSVEREMLDKQIALESEKQRDTLLLTNQLDIQSTKSTLEMKTNESLAIQDTVKDLVAKQEKLDELISSSGKGDQNKEALEAERDARQAEIDRLNAQVEDNASDIIQANTKIMSLEQDQTNLVKGNPKEISFRKQLKYKYAEKLEDASSREGQFNTISNMLDGVNSGFTSMIDNLVQASDGVDGFFNNLIGKTKEGREAWRQFGMSILTMAMKVMTDRMMLKLMNYLMGIGDPAASGGKGLPTSANGGGTNFLLSALQIGASAYFGGGAGASAATVTAQPSLGPQAPLMSFPMAEGGEVKGGLPNRDSVPIMAMAGEYIIPKQSSEFLGKNFLDGLRTNPSSTMKNMAATGAALSNRAPVDQTTNVYVVSPDKVPNGMSKNDIIVTVSDDLARNGPISQLIKKTRNSA